jgi:hypothetical protein
MLGHPVMPVQRGVPVMRVIRVAHLQDLAKHLLVVLAVMVGRLVHPETLVMVGVLEIMLFGVV